MDDIKKHTSELGDVISVMDIAIGTLRNTTQELSQMDTTVCDIHTCNIFYEWIRPFENTYRKTSSISRTKF